MKMPGETHPGYIEDYFDYCSYKYASTHWVGGRQTVELGANWNTKKYLCFFDITSNDGHACHYISESLNCHGLETQRWALKDAVTTDYMIDNGDNSGTDSTYNAGTDSVEIYNQIDDFTEADGVNDDDGDQPAHRKNNELLASVSQSIYQDLVVF